MGCFNVAGTMSNISIGYGDRAVLIPLVPNWTHTHEQNVRLNKRQEETTKAWLTPGSISRGPESMIVSNEGARADFDPRFLPIFGEYDDYGRLEKIERDANVEYIEAYFGIDIDQFVDAICNGDAPEEMDEELSKELDMMSAMFEHRDVFDAMVAHAKEHDCNAYQEARLNHQTMQELGFVDVTETEPRLAKKYTDKRYNIAMKHPDIPGLVAATDKRWSHFYWTDETKKWYNSAFCPSDLGDLISKRGFDLSEISPRIEELKNENTMRLTVERAFKKTEEMREREKLIQTIEDDAERNAQETRFRLEMMAHQRDFEMIIINGQWGDGHLMYVYEDERLIEATAELLLFERMMYSSNNIYGPASNGEQHGNMQVSKKLYETALEVTEAKIKYYEEG